MFWMDLETRLVCHCSTWRFYSNTSYHSSLLVCCACSVVLQLRHAKAEWECTYIIASANYSSVIHPDCQAKLPKLKWLWNVHFSWFQFRVHFLSPKHTHQVNSALAQGDYDNARSASKTAMWLNVAGISIGSILLVGGIAFLIVYLTVLNPVG